MSCRKWTDEEKQIQSMKMKKVWEERRKNGTAYCSEECKQKKREYWRKRRENGTTLTGIPQLEDITGYNKSYQAIYREKHKNYYKLLQQYKRDKKKKGFIGTFKEYLIQNNLKIDE